MKQVGGTPDQFAAYSYAAVLAFADAVNAIVKTDGVNGLTRTDLINAIKGLTDFDAGGMLGKRSFANGKTTSCFLIVQFKSGKWVAPVPDQEGHLRLQGVERDRGQGEPDQAIAVRNRTERASTGRSAPVSRSRRMSGGPESTTTGLRLGPAPSPRSSVPSSNDHLTWSSTLRAIRRPPAIPR